MIEDSALECCVVQENGGPPTAFCRERARRECHLRGWPGFRGRHAHRLDAEAPYVFFNASERWGVACRIAAGRFLTKPRSDRLRSLPVGYDYASDVVSGAAIFVAVDPGKGRIAAAEYSAIEASLIDRMSRSDTTLLDLAHGLAAESADAYPKGLLVLERDSRGLRGEQIARSAHVRSAAASVLFGKGRVPAHSRLRWPISEESIEAWQKPENSLPPPNDG